MIIDINTARKVSTLAEEILKINTSRSAEVSDMTAHIFQIDPTVTLDNGDHPVVATTLNEFGSWVVAQPTGDFEKSYKENEEFSKIFHLMQSEDDNKTSATFFGFTSEIFSMILGVHDLVESLRDEAFIGVVYFNDGIDSNPLFIIRFDQDAESTVVEIFDIK